MWLESLTVKQVRNLTDIKITLSKEVNIIYGENAAGKTALLESIYLLSKARSFRTAHIKEVIQHQKEELTVSGIISGKDNRFVNTGIRKSFKETEIRHNGERVRAVSQQAKNVIVQTVIPDNAKLLTGSPKDRRKWVDWALFHVEQTYLQIWQKYHQALRNRNALLRRPSKEEEFYVWEKIMATTAKELGNMWSKYFVCLQSYYQEIAKAYSCDDVVFSIKKEKITTGEYLEYLQLTRQSDIKAGFTQQGPHKADFNFKTEGKHAHTVFSRGQIKLFVTMLSIAQAKLLKKEKEVTPIILVDDLVAELDKKAVSTLLEILYNEKMQLFIATTEPDVIEKSSKETALFHVEQGQVKNVRMGSISSNKIKQEKDTSL